MEEQRLFEELAKIGRVEKTTKPSALEKYPTLLHSPRVQNRAGPGASIAQLALAANEALTAAIAEIVVPLDRAVAEAVLATTEDFEGQSIQVRKNLLAASPFRVSGDQYRRARERILGWLATYLLRTNTTQSLARLPKKAAEFSTDPVVASLQVFSGIVAHLHYIGLGSLFMGSIHDELVDAGLVNEPPVIAGEPLFEPGESLQASHDLALVYLACISHTFPYPPCMLAEPSTFSPPLSSDAAALLVDHIVTLRRLGPDVDPDLDTTELLIRFLKNWHAFNSEAVNKPDSESRQAFEQLIATSGAAARLVGEHVPYHEPIFAKARTVAHKFVSGQYGFDEWLPVISGHSLHARAERYFDQNGIG